MIRPSPRAPWCWTRMSTFLSSRPPAPWSRPAKGRLGGPPPTRSASASRRSRRAAAYRCSSPRLGRLRGRPRALRPAVGAGACRWRFRARRAPSTTPADWVHSGRSAHRPSAERSPSERGKVRLRIPEAVPRLPPWPLSPGHRHRHHLLLHHHQNSGPHPAHCAPNRAMCHPHCALLQAQPRAAHRHAGRGGRRVQRAL